MFPSPRTSSVRLRDPTETKKKSARTSRRCKVIRKSIHGASEQWHYRYADAVAATPAATAIDAVVVAPATVAAAAVVVVKREYAEAMAAKVHSVGAFYCYPPADG